MIKKTFQPIIKWSGSKRSQSEGIVNRFPREIGTYYEPFVGSAAVLRRLLDIQGKKDYYKERVNTFNSIKRGNNRDGAFHRSVTIMHNGYDPMESVTAKEVE